MRLYDTNKKSYCSWQPPQLVRIYVCGITPYDSAHLGHIFTFMTYDLLQRRLEDLGREVQMVRNITDVDEPIYARAAQLGTDYVSLANAEIVSFRDILQSLNFRGLYGEPQASNYISEMAAAVQILIDKGYGYRVEHDIYFDTCKYQHFGQFSGYSQRLLRTLMAARGGDPERPGKRHPLDFLLWKYVADPGDKAQWQTVLGSGRPGWHIECTVMSSNLLGDSFDLHGGGSDLIFPHHEAEIAQSMTLYGTMPARHWLHVSPLLLYGEKISKSLGNMVFAKDLLREHDAATIRLSLMHYHHRDGGEWRPELLGEASQLLERVQVMSRRCDDACAKTLLTDVRAALDDDLDTPAVIAALQHFVHASCTKTTQRAAAHPAVLQTLDILGLSA